MIVVHVDHGPRTCTKRDRHLLLRTTTTTADETNNEDIECDYPTVVDIVVVSGVSDISDNKVNLVYSCYRGMYY